MLSAILTYTAVTSPGVGQYILLTAAVAKRRRRYDHSSLVFVRISKRPPISNTNQCKACSE